VKLLSIPALLQEYPGKNVNTTSTGLTLSGCKTGVQTNSVYSTIDVKCNLPVSQAYRHSSHEKLPETLLAAVGVVDRENQNLSAAAKEWLGWHFRLGHMSLQRIQFLMRTGFLAKNQSMRYLHTAIGKLQFAPKCAACLFAKSKRKPTKSQKTHARVVDQPGALTKKIFFQAKKSQSITTFAPPLDDCTPDSENPTTQVSTRVAVCSWTMQPDRFTLCIRHL
jgi:hypothetical protein